MENVNKSTREALETRVKNSRGNLLFVIGFTLINIILLVVKSDSYFLFSAFIPYAIVDVGMYLCGMYPADLYDAEFALADCFDSSVLAVFIGVAVLFLAVYLLCWIFSKKNKIGWLIFALIFFVIDTIGMFLLSETVIDNIIDIVFHAWVIISLAMAINACAKLRKMPIEEVREVNGQESVEGDNASDLVNSSALRVADLDVKSRVLVETEHLGYAIVYRRVKRTNELVINGNVYDEVEMLIETPHTLKANVDGHIIEAEYNSNFSYIKVDGEVVAKKIRWY